MISKIEVNNIGERIKRYREEKEIGQAELATVVGCSPSMLSLWENNRRKLTNIDTIWKISLGLNIPMEYLFVEEPFEREPFMQKVKEKEPKKVKDKSSISKKNHITKLQYANAIFIERNAILEREWKEALRKAKEWQDEYNHVRSQVFHVFGEKYGSLFMKRGMEVPEGIIQGIKKLLKELENELHSN